MVITPSVRQELELEHSIRCVEAHEDSSKVRALCASLMRQNWYQQQLIRQATGHIAKLELEDFLSSTRQGPNLIQRLFRALLG